jgi:hypothetical protein
MSGIAPIGSTPDILYSGAGGAITPAGYLSALPTQGIFTKEQIEELASLLPTPYVMPAEMQVTFQRIGDLMGLMAIQSNLRTNDLSDSDHSVIMAALDAWMKSEEVRAAALQEQLRSDAQNPLALALQQYISSGGAVNINFNLLQLLQNSPILLSGLAGVDTQVQQKALDLAESALILSLLGQIMEGNEIQAQATGGTLSPSALLLQGYINGVQNGTIQLSQPMLTFILTGMTGTGDVRYQDTIAPQGQDVIFNLVSTSGALYPGTSQGTLDTLATNLSQLFQNIQVSASYWAIPAGLSLVSGDKSDPTQSLTESSVRAYALTLEKFVMGSGFYNFVAAIIACTSKPGDNISTSQIDQYVTYIRVLLLSNALAAVDKMATGGVIFNEADFTGYLDGSISVSKEDVRYSLYTNIQTLLAGLPSDERAALIAKLVNYYSTNPDISALMDTTKVFLALTHPRFAESVASQQPH